MGMMRPMGTMGTMGPAPGYPMQEQRPDDAMRQVTDLASRVERWYDRRDAVIQGLNQLQSLWGHGALFVYVDPNFNPPHWQMHPVNEHHPDYTFAYCEMYNRFPSTRDEDGQVG